MSIETLILKNSKIHQLAIDTDRVINAFEYTESDPKAAYKPASVTKICIDQLERNLSVLNNGIGQDWPKSKQ